MTTIYTIPAHEIVQRTYPRPLHEEDEVKIAVGRAIDGSLSHFSHEFRQGRRPTVTAMRTYAESLLTEELLEVTEAPSSSERADLLEAVNQSVMAFRKTPAFGLPRPKSRVILINNQVGVYAQPDYWDGTGRFYEMKSYRAIPPPPDIALQLRLFQLAFPRFESVLLCIDRHAKPIETSSLVVPPPTAEETLTVLRQAFQLGREHGQPKVLEYVEGPLVYYDLPGDAGPEAQ
ncbi:MAG: hypothetical protein ABSB97_01430 [Thermoplasmata archaeon]|jgi:hypothetical protein